MVQARGFSFPILVDPDAAVMKAMGAYNRNAPLHGHYIPHPSLAVIDRAGLLQHFEIRKKVVGRIGVTEILRILDKLPSDAVAETP